MNIHSVSSKPRVWPLTGYIVALALIFGLALFIRIYFRQDDVFGSGWVRFAETDPWYHIRLLENLLQHFPQRISFDPYTFFPFGRNVFFAPFFDLILGFFVWVIGWGSPSQNTLEVVAAYFPAVAGALITIPVFFLGKELFNKNTGLICALLVAFMPGNFLARSLLGVTDHHVIEIIFRTVTLLFLILLIKSSRENEIRFSDVIHFNWGRCRKPLLFSVLCGISLAFYMLSWVGGLIFLLIIFACFVVLFIVDHLSGRNTDYLCLMGVPVFLVAMLLVLPFSNLNFLTALHPLPLLFSIVALVVLSAISTFMAKKLVKRYYFPLAIVVLGGIFLAALYLAAESLFASVTGAFDIFFREGESLTITEVQPLFSGFSFSSLSGTRVWAYFTTGLFYVPVGFVLLLISLRKRLDSGVLVFLVWSLMMLLAMMGQNRFSYYFAVNTALFGGYICWQIWKLILGGIHLLGFSEKKPEISEVRIRKHRGQAKTKQNIRYSPAFYASVGLAALIGFFGVLFPNIPQLSAITTGVPGPNNDWRQALVWMKDNTPEPLGDSSSYYDLYEVPPERKYAYPESAYGVMSWWDYGHWITAIAQRIPNSNAFQDGASSAARFFTCLDEKSACEQLDALGSKYVILDISMATSTFNSITSWTESPRLIEYYYQKSQSGKLERVAVYHPDYYRSMCSRLYNFSGEAVIPDKTQVIKTAKRLDGKGNSFIEIIQAATFKTFEEAQKYIQDNPEFVIVGTDPFVSPVPLQKLDHFNFVFGSETVIKKQETRDINYVQVYEYQKNKKVAMKNRGQE